MSAAMNATLPRMGIATLMSGFGPKPFLAPPDEIGGDPDAAAKAAAAEKAVADAAAAKAAEEKAAADKTEAERKAAEEAEKNMSEADREKQKLLREVMEKKGKLKETEEALAAARAEADKFKGIDLDKVKSLVEAEKLREEKELEAKGEFDRLKARIAEEREAERKAWLEEKKALENQVKTLAGSVDNLTIGNDFATSTFIKDDLVLTPTKARALYGSYFEVKDGKRIPYDKPAGAAGRTPLIDAAGEPLAFDAAMRKIIDADPDKDTLLKAKVTPGAASKNVPGTKSQQETNQSKGSLYGASRILAGLNAGQK
ncbi:DUF6651 domain-containing protein [Shinella zoogloeoides]|uniref:DUF6651 domain-containing protein n=1 Tax=Shinella zoogloeoides TaxID=352475 RepID=UPI00273DF0B8|nr:DUF6651 domain-containing protein [Shinella zoogloeoides]WLR90993.1 hypothetical protein Q9316_00160 [Shinella zoogloeoides]